MPAKVIGLTALAAKLRNVRISADDLETALRTGSFEIVNAAKQNAPVLTGQLRRSIRVWTKVSGDEAEARIGTNLDYARRIEFGFVGADKLGRRYNQAAKPYLRPALKAKREKALEIIRDEIRKSVRSGIRSL